MSLKQRIERWHSAGLITREQADRIAAYEDDGPTSARWLVWSIAALGGLAIVGGIISVIASNWDDIPDGLKLTLGVGLLAALPLVALRFGERADGWPRDLLLFIHQLLVLGVIGLVGQVFHLSGSPWRPFAVTTALALPAALAARRSLHFDVLIGLALLTVGLLLEEHGLWQPLWRNSLQAFAVGATIGAIFYSGGELLRRAGHRRIVPSLQRWGAALVAVCVLCEAVRWSADDPNPGPEQHIGFVALAIATVTTFAVFRRFDPARLVGAACAIVLLLGPELFFAETTAATKAAGFALCTGFCIAWAFVAAELGSRRGVNIATIALALRIVVVFFELFDSLLDTGLGLLLTGVVLIGVAYAWWRFRGAIPLRAAGTPQGAS